MTRDETHLFRNLKDVAFSLREGEISDAFGTPFGFISFLLKKLRGQ